MKKIIRKIMGIIPIIFFCSILVSSIILYFTPNPIFIIANFLPVESNLTKPDNFSSIEKNSEVKTNIIYSKRYPNSLLDMYYPKLQNGKKAPVILFVHGGGFFKGDKEMTKYFGPTFSNSKYVFVSINYNLVPSATIFDQVRQISDALHFIVKNADKYSLDINDINLSGSSAGGFLALQLMSAYYNEEYKQELGIQCETIDINSILLYSAVYDLSEFQKNEESAGLNYIVSKLGWGLTGEKRWKEDKYLGEVLNLNNYISKDFPPVFITDGNTNTFTAQAKNYANKLKQINVPVKILFFGSEENVGHGYQLDMKSEFSKKAIIESLNFLKH